MRTSAQIQSWMQRTIKDFFDGLTSDSKVDFYTWRFHENGITGSNGIQINHKQVEQRYAELRASISFLFLEKLEEGKVEMKSDTEAIYSTKIKYDCVKQGEKEIQSFDGKLIIHLEPCELAGMWGVTMIKCPGITFF